MLRVGYNGELGGAEGFIYGFYPKGGAVELPSGTVQLALQGIPLHLQVPLSPM